MKKIFLNGLITGAILLLLSYLLLVITVRVLPDLAWEYFGPSFNTASSRNVLFYIHPFLLGLALAWFWDRFKGLFKGVWILKGLEMGIMYALIATLPSMWITFSAINVSFEMIGTWFLYGLFQSIIAGEVLARLNP